MRTRTLALVPLLNAALLVAITPPAGALLPGSASDPGLTGLEVQLPALERSRLSALISGEPTRLDERAPAAAHLPGEWEVRWNRLTGTPHRLYGSGLDLRPGGFRSAAEVDRVSRAFVSERPELAGVAADDLVLTTLRHAAGHWSAIYQQVDAGVPVEGARVDFLYTESGRLVLFGSDAYPVVDRATAASLPAAAALAAGAAGLPSPTTAVGPELRILPVPSARPGKEEIEMVHHLAYRMILETSEPPGRWITWVDASSGEILWRHDDIRYLEIEGVVWGAVEDPGYCDGANIRPFPHLGVDVAGVPTVFTDIAGNYSATVPDMSQRTVSAMLRGQHVRVLNQLLGGSNASFSTVTTPGDPVFIDWASAQQDERNVYLYVNRAYDFIRSIDGTSSLGVLDGQLPANVSINATCNAFWNGSSLNFYIEGDGCVNSGRIGDVVIHEYGHGVSDVVYSPYGIPGDMGEGNSDIIATHMTERSLVGDGFFIGQCGTGIRDCDNDLRYPEDVVGQEIHDAGRVICGFDWHARKNLEMRNRAIFAGHSDSLWHYTRLLALPMSMNDQVLGYFLLDDDDANLANGSPHYLALCQAAERHGLDTPGPAAVQPVTITHLPLRSTTDSENAYEVRAVITSTAGAIDMSETRLRYRYFNNGEVVVPMTPTGSPDEYRGLIQARPVGSRISYTITTADQVGNRGAHPPQRCVPETPNGAEVFHVAAILDELEVESGWTVGAPGDNALTGIWTRVDPLGTGAQPEDDRTPVPGDSCFVTGQGTPGGALGEADVDGGRTTLLSPVYDLSAYEVAELLYHRWYSNNRGAEPNQDIWVVDASNDGGNSWVNVETTNLSDHSWKEVRVGLNGLFGTRPNQVQVRFIAADEDPGSLVEGGVDDFMIFAWEGPVAVGDDPPPGAPATRFTLGPNVPNPFNPSTTIRFELPRRAALSLLVYDSHGRLARVLADQVIHESGDHELTWDGRDDRGERVSSGVYQVLMVGPGFSESRKVVMVK